MITHIAAVAFKGQTFDLEIKSPVLLIEGDNGAGKSARLEALGLALLGYVPGDQKPAKLARDIHRAYGRAGDRMRVGASLSSGDGIARTWTPDQDSVSATTDLVGRGFQVPAELLDLTAFTSLSGAERQKFLAAAAPATITARNAAVELAAAIGGCVLTGGPEQAVQQARALAERVLASGNETKNNDSATDWLAAQSAELKASAAAARQHLKRLQQTVQGLALTATEPVADTVGVEQRLAVARDALVAAKVARGEADALITRTRAKWTELAELNKRWEATLLRRAELDALKAQRGEPPPEPDDAAMQKAENAYAAALARYNAAASESSRISAELAEQRATTVCRTCGQTLGVAHQAAVACLEARYQQALEREAGLKVEAVTASQEITNLKPTWEAQRRQVTQYTMLCRDIHRLESALHGAPEQDPGPALQEAEMEGKLAAADLASKRELERAAIEEVKRLEVLDAARLKRLADEAARARVLEELESAKAALAVAHTASEIAQSLTAEFARRSVQPVLDLATGVAGELLPGPLAWDPEAGEVTVAGRPMRSLSDSERACTEAGLRLALASASRAEGDLRLLVLPRLEALDAVRRETLLARVVDLVHRSTIQQAILVGVGDGLCPERLREWVQVVTLKGGAR